MTTSLDRWEKDPFFAAAEEVQESADRFRLSFFFSHINSLIVRDAMSISLLLGVKGFGFKIESFFLNRYLNSHNVFILD